MCDCDYEAPRVYVATLRTARKPHKCGECGHVIQPGEQYEHVFGVWDGQPDSFKTCGECVAARDWFREASKEFCFAHGNIWNDMIDWAGDGALTRPGDNMRFGRILVAHRGRRKARVAA